MSAGFKRFILSVVFAAQVACALPVLAVQPDEIMSDPAQEARARTLSRELRCMVCQNQSIDDSDAPLARDLRLLVRERIKAGDSDAQVMDFLVARYGAFVLLKPPFESRTLALWLLPPLVLAVGTLLLVSVSRRRRLTGANQAGEDTPLSADERARLAELTGRNGNPPQAAAQEPARRTITKV